MSFQLAQLNLARVLAPVDDPRLQGFVDIFDEVDALAEAAPGMIWRNPPYAPDSGIWADDVLPTLSVWQDIEALHHFTFNGLHLQAVRRRRDWFLPYGDVYLVMWWVPAGHIPTFQEGAERLDLLRLNGPTPEAFTFSAPFPAPTDDNQYKPVQSIPSAS